MSNKKDIEEDIKILKTFKTRYKTINYNKISLEDVQAIENILADRERLIEMLNKSDTENIKLQKEIEEFKNDEYWKRIYSKTKWSSRNM